MSYDDDLRNLKNRELTVDDVRSLDLNIRDEPRPIPSTGIFDAPYRCYQINEEWDKHISGAILALAEWRAWEGEEDETNLAVQEVLKLLNTVGCGGTMSYKLRQNSLDPCLIEQSFDDGENWSVAWRFDLCDRTEFVEIPDSAQVINDYNDFIDSYDDNPFSVAPDMEYDESPADATRDLALCQALQDFVRVICKMELDKRQQYALGLTISSIFLTLVGIAITVTSFGTGALLYVALAAALLGAGGTIWSVVSDQLLLDYETQDILACCMYTALKSQNITRELFEASLDGCDFTPLSNEAQLSGAVSPSLEFDGVFETFLKGLQQAYDYAELGIAYCPCEENPTWEYDSDFADDPNGWVASVRSSGNPLATWAETSGWSQVSVLAATPNQYWRATEISINFATPVYVSNIEMIFDLTKGSFATDSTSYRINGLLFGSLQTSAVVNHSGATNGTGKTVSLNPEQLLNQITLLVRSSFQAVPAYSGSNDIVSCHIEGTGIKPPELTQTLE